MIAVQGQPGQKALETPSQLVAFTYYSSHVGSINRRMEVHPGIK
jgi:hypothetical protein